MDKDQAIAEQVKCADDQNVIVKDAIRSAKAGERDCFAKKMRAEKSKNACFVSKLNVQQNQITELLHRSVSAEVHLKKKTKDMNSSAKQCEDVQQAIGDYEQQLVALAEKNTAIRAADAEIISSLKTALD